MTEPYLRHLQPPGPALTPRLQAVAGEANTGDIQAVVDTGADATIVPLRYLLEIGAEETAPGWRRSFSGERVPVGLYFVDIRLDGQVLPGVRVAGSRLVTEVLLGRDVLNKLALLDGPHAEITLPDPAPLPRLRGKR